MEENKDMEDMKKIKEKQKKAIEDITRVMKEISSKEFEKNPLKK